MVNVTVLTPSRNYAAFIEDAINSVRAQPGVSVQHVVQDGDSSDDTVAILERHDDHVDWSSQPDAGQSDALNRALRKATGRWIAWLNADEFYLPAGLANLISASERSGADVVFGDCVIVDEAGRVTRLLAHHRFSPRVLRNYGTCISSCAAIFRRSTLGTDPWDVDIRRVMDWDLYLKLLDGGAKFLHIPYPVGVFRTHADQVTAAPWHVWQREDEFVAARYGRPTELRERWRAHTRWRWLHRGHKLLDGAFLRERRARPIVGRDVRWFRSPSAYENAVRLLERVYGRPPGVVVDSHADDAV